MKILNPTRIALTLSTCGVFAFGAAQAAQALHDDDREFLQKAAVSGQLVIEASTLAQQRGMHPELKRYAEMMVQNHTAAGQALKALAARKSVSLPTGLDKDAQSKLDDLKQEKDGKDFDEEYADEIAVNVHDDAVELFEDAAEDARDADIKTFAAQTLPTLKTHLEQGRALEKAVDAHNYDDQAAQRRTPAAAGRAN